jgi:predicted RNase H-like nuclease (RuvC/YqgF family)
MNKFKFFIFSITTLAILGLGVYWAFVSIESGSTHVSKEKVEALENRNDELEEEIEDLKNELTLYKEKEEQEVLEEITEEKTQNQEITTYKYQNLIDEIQDLINDKIVMKVGSKGTRVGTIQNFLNLYNNTTKRVDNDYGKTTKTDIANFQKKVELSQTGETGITTYQKMIDWLKSQG